MVLSRKSREPKQELTYLDTDSMEKMGFTGVGFFGFVLGFFVCLGCFVGFFLFLFVLKRALSLLPFSIISVDTVQKN